MAKKNRFGLNLSFLSNLSIAAKIGIMVSAISVALVIVYFVAIAPLPSSSTTPPGTPPDAPPGPPPDAPSDAPSDAPPKPPPDAPPTPPPDAPSSTSFFGAIDKNNLVYISNDITEVSTSWTPIKQSIKVGQIFRYTDNNGNPMFGAINLGNHRLVYTSSQPGDPWSGPIDTKSHFVNLFQQNDKSFIGLADTYDVYTSTSTDITNTTWNYYITYDSNVTQLFQLNDNTIGIIQSNIMYTADSFNPTIWNKIDSDIKFIWILQLNSTSYVVLDTGNVMYTSSSINGPWVSVNNGISTNFIQLFLI